MTREAAQFAVKIRRVSFFRSAQANKIQGFVLSLPLCNLSGPKNRPGVQRDRRAEGDTEGGRYTAEHPRPRGCSSGGRAAYLEAGGQRFESDNRSEDHTYELQSP